MKKKIILLATNSYSTRILYNSLNNEFEIEAVVIEKKISFLNFLKFRYKKLRFYEFIDQILFLIFINKFLKIISRSRLKEIMIENSLIDTKIPPTKVIFIDSVNSEACVNILLSIKPDLILVNGTRIISKNVLQKINVLFLNIHAGITPQYRGVHGAYWAYFTGKNELAGVTLHQVDSGVDTGNIICQSKITITSKDNFSTYPLLQLSIGISMLKVFLANYFMNKNYLGYKFNSNQPSIQWYHPGFVQYILKYIKNGVK